MAMHWLDKIRHALRPSAPDQRSNARPVPHTISADALIRTLNGHAQDTNTVHRRLRK